MFRNSTEVEIAKAFPKSRGCCQRVSGQVSGVDRRYAVFKDAKCSASKKICSMPAQANSIWVCGCPGKSCYGERGAWRVRVDGARGGGVLFMGAGCTAALQEGASSHTAAACRGGGGPQTCSNSFAGAPLPPP